MGRGRPGMDSGVNVMACIQMLRIVCSYGSLDDRARVGKETSTHYFRVFIQHLITIYRQAFLNHRPCSTELRIIELKYRETGFNGCAEAVHCMKMYWKNGSFALKR